MTMLIRRIKYAFVIVILVSMTKPVTGQTNGLKTFSFGTNLIKIPAKTIDVIFDLHQKSNVDFCINGGYGFNHTGYDLSVWLTGMCKCGNDGYIIEEQKGWYFKLGARYNVILNTDSKSYLFVGSYFANSFIKEKAKYDLNWDNPNPIPNESQMVDLSHNIYIIGLTCYSGISINIIKQLSLEVGLEAGIPTNKYKDLYGYENFIPGIGVKGNSDQTRWFPQILFNLKYNINNNP